MCNLLDNFEELCNEFINDYDSAKTADGEKSWRVEKWEDIFNKFDKYKNADKVAFLFLYEDCGYTVLEATEKVSEVMMLENTTLEEYAKWSYNEEYGDIPDILIGTIDWKLVGGNMQSNREVAYMGEGWLVANPNEF